MRTEDVQMADAVVAHPGAPAFSASSVQSLANPFVVQFLVFPGPKLPAERRHRTLELVVRRLAYREGQLQPGEADIE